MPFVRIVRDNKGKIRLRFLPGQDFDEEINIQSNRSIRDTYSVGTILFTNDEPQDQRSYYSYSNSTIFSPSNLSDYNQFTGRRHFLIEDKPLKLRKKRNKKAKPIIEIPKKKESIIGFVRNL